MLMNSILDWSIAAMLCNFCSMASPFQMMIEWNRDSNGIGLAAFICAGLSALHINSPLRSVVLRRRVVLPVPSWRWPFHSMAVDSTVGGSAVTRNVLSEALHT